MTSKLIVNSLAADTGVSTITFADQAKMGNSLFHSTGFTIGDSFLHSTGVNLTNVNATGVITATKFVGEVSVGSSITFEDNEKAYFGTGTDFSIYHNGSASYLDETGTGGLIVKTDTAFQVFNSAGSQAALTVTPGGAVELYHNNSKKFETMSYGAKWTGILLGADNQKLELGSSGDLSLYHDGTNSYIDNVNTGILRIRGGAGGSGRDIEIQAKNGEYSIRAIPNGSVELYWNNLKKFETSSVGWKSEDGVKGIFGTDGDFQIFHNGSNSFVKKLSSGTGQLYLDSEGSSDLYLRAGDGSSGTNISMRCYSNAGVDLRYQGTKKFETTSSGVTVAAGSDIRFTNGTWTGEVAGKIQHNSNNLYIQGGTGGIRFRHASSGVNQFSMTNGGNFEITNGNLVVASGHGIDFSANTDGGGTSSATLLEDYEEGSYTITSNTNLTLDNNRTGYYTKVGNMVTVTGYLSLNTNDGSPSVSGSNNIVLSLPYAVNTSSGTYTGTMLQQNIDSDTPTSSVGHPLWYKTLPVDYVCLAASDGLRFYINYMEAAYTRMNNSHLHVGYPGYTYIAWNITYRTN
tara:strand:- start:26 stop:1744 length:1719 start_codon:yes stop_codon:yes gene_type:complete